MRNNNFDLLRLSLAFIVVFGHLIELSGVDEFKVFGCLFNTYLAFTGFFCISGFLIARSFKSSSSISLYFKKRAARLLPAYILVVVFSGVFLSLISTYDLNEYFSHKQFYKYLSSNLMFLNFLEPCLPGVFTSNPLHCSVNGALWTLKIEVAFYILLPILIYFLSKTKRKLILLLLIYFLSILYKNILQNFGSDYFLVLSRQLPGFMSYFSCGIALTFYFDFFIKNKNKILIVALVFFILEKHFSLEILTPLAWSIIVFAFAFSLKRLNSVIKFGDISYGVYIYHCPIIQTATAVGLFEKYNPYMIALSVILTIIFVSLASWHLLEKRWLNRVRK